MRWFARISVVVVMLILVGCGGGSKAATSTTSRVAAPTAASGGQPTAATGASTSAPTTAAAITPTTVITAPTVAAATTPTTAAPAAPGQATAADANFPDVHVPLKVGSSGEAPSSDPDPTTVNDTQGTVKVTIVAITDHATTTSPIFQPEAGNHYWAVEVTMQATGNKVVNTGQWTLHTTDGNDYGTVYLTGVGEDITYGALAAGESKRGVLVFQIPDGATVQWLWMNPSIYVGNQLFFDAS